MATYGSKDVGFILLGGANLVAQSGEFSDKVVALNDEKTPLGVEWTQHAYVGMRRADLRQSGWFDDATGAAHETSMAAEGVSRVLSWNVEGNVLGQTFNGYAGVMQIDYERMVEGKKLTMARAAYNGTGQADLGGVILQPLEQKSSSFNTEATPVDYGSSTSAGGAAYLHVISMGGVTSLAVKIRHAAAAVFADLAGGAFAAVTSAQGQRITIASGVTINRNLAIDVVFTGVGTPTMMVGFKRF
jgi:hypothetical protein